MSKKNYKVHNVFLKKIDFEVLILAIPEDEIEDKLAYLAREKGQITKSLFEDFVLATCMANINQLLHRINQQISNQEELLAIREELLEELYNVNPKLKPEDLLINKNFVIKLKINKKLKKDEKSIVDTKYWDVPYYDDIANAYDDYFNEQNEELPPPPPPSTEEAGGKINGKLKNDSSDNKDINTLKYEVTKKWWKRMGQYVDIKKYSPEDITAILKQRYFHDKASFATFIVSICVQDFKELFALLDIKGIPSRVSPPRLMEELYELCRECNELLTFENAQKLSEKTNDKRNAPNRTSSSHSQSILDQMKNKREKFRDVPKKELMTLKPRIKKHLIGQEEVVNVVTDAIQRASVGLKDPIRPIGSFLFAGQTGVGKSLSAKILANELTRNEEGFVVIDCSEYSAEHEYAKLIGSPSGYVGFEQGGRLTNAISKNPFSIVVFDEIEKANHKVHELLLQILEEGRLTDGKGNIVSFKETVIIMTSNVGASEIEAIKKSIGFGDASMLTDRKKDAALTEALKKKFRPEFLNRIDSIVNFKKLTKRDYMKIVTIELNKLNDNLKSNDTEYKNISLYFDRKIKNLIYKKGVNDAYGARPIKRYIEKNVSTLLAKKLIATKNVDNIVVKISTVKEEITITIDDKKPKVMVKETK